MEVSPMTAIQLSLTIFHLTDINTTVLNGNGTVYVQHLHDALPSFVEDEQHSLYLPLMQEAGRSEQCCLYTTERGISYLIKRLEDTGSKWLMIGPFLTQVPDISRFDGGHVIDYDQSKQIQFAEWIRGLKILGLSKVQSMANIIGSAAYVRQASVRMIDTPRAVQRPLLPANDSWNEPHDEFVELIELRYKMESEMMQAIEQGDSNKLRRIHGHANHMFDFTERFPNRPIRAMKNSLTVLNTLLRVAAGRANVHPLFLHAISESFAKKIEKSDTIAVLNDLRERMFADYCELAATKRPQQGTSAVIQKAMQFMTVNYKMPFELRKLADFCLLHPTHLSRQFKKETGRTPTEFHLMRRIEEAKRLLKATSNSIGWIASCVGFDDAGYFSRLFRKREGMTPKEYRDRHRQPI